MYPELAAILCCAGERPPASTNPGCAFLQFRKSGHGNWGASAFPTGPAPKLVHGGLMFRNFWWVLSCCFFLVLSWQETFLWNICGRLLRTTRIDSRSAAFVGTERSMGQGGFFWCISLRPGDVILTVGTISLKAAARLLALKCHFLPYCFGWSDHTNSLMNTRTLLQPLRHFVKKKSS